LARNSSILSRIGQFGHQFLGENILEIITLAPDQEMGLSPGFNMADLSGDLNETVPIQDHFQYQNLSSSGEPSQRFSKST
jgi:hypothetical protein